CRLRRGGFCAWEWIVESGYKERSADSLSPIEGKFGVKDNPPRPAVGRHISVPEYVVGQRSRRFAAPDTFQQDKNLFRLAERLRLPTMLRCSAFAFRPA